MQRAGNQPCPRTHSPRLVQVGRMANAARADQRSPGRARLHATQRIEVGAGVGADALQRHHDHALGPQRGHIPATRRIEANAVAPVEREHGARRRGKARLDNLARPQRLAAEHRDHTSVIGAELLAQCRSSSGIGKTGVEPDFDAWQRTHDLAQRTDLRGTALQRVKVGNVQSSGGAMVDERAGHGHRLGARTQHGHDRPVQRTLTTLRTHHLAMHDVNDGYELHGTEADSTAMKRVWVYEYLSGGGDDHGDALLRMGVSMRDAMVTDLLQIDGCSVSAATCSRAKVLPQGAAGTQADAGESPAAFVARQAALHDAVWLVAPETDGLLAHLHSVVPAARWLGCDAASIVLASSKRATTDCLAACGVQTPLAFANDRSTRRWVTKPDDGAGAADTRVHADLSAARDHGGPAAVIEPWIEGTAMSLSLLCRSGQFDLLCANRQQIAIDGQGRVSFEGVSIDRQATVGVRRADFEQTAREVVRAIPGLHGFVGIDFVWHDSRGPVVIEVNPRVTCAYVGLSAALGRNLALELLRA